MSPDIVPFHDVSPLAVAGLVLIYFLSFLIRGLIGFGSAMPAVLGSAWILPPHDAVLIALLTSVFAQVQMLPQGFRDADWKVTRPLLAGTLLSILLGVWIFASLKAGSLTVVLGACLTFAVLADMAQLTKRLAARLPLDHFSVVFTLGALAGLIAGLAGAGANYFMSFYVRWAVPRPLPFRATNIIISGVMSLWRAAISLGIGLITVKLVLEAALVMPAVYAGGWAGRRLMGRLSDRRYFMTFQILLLLASLGLIWKGLGAPAQP